MKQFKFTQNYGEHKKGDVIDMKLNIYHQYIHPLVMRGILEVIRSDKEIRDAVIEEIDKVEDEENQLLIDKLLEKDMKDLQKFARSFGAKDTKKSELIAELLQKAPINDIKKYAGEK